MANLGDLKNRIVVESNRDDLLDDLASSLTLSIQRAINFYAIQRFEFNQQRLEDVTVPNNQYLSLPAGTRVLDDVFLLIGGVRYYLVKKSMEEIEDLYSTPLGGQPTFFCYFQDQIRFWPTPQQAYPIVWLTVVDEPPLISDTDENNWTNTGQDIIVGRAKLYLYRDFWRDPEGAAAATVQMNEALMTLKGESNRKIGTGRVQCRW